MRRMERGGVFLIALAALVGLVSVLASVAATQRLAIRAQINRDEALRARLAADAAVQRAIAEIALIEPGQPVLLTDSWATLGNGGSDRFLVGNAAFRIQVLDASSFINMNTAPEAHLQRLPITQQQLDCWLDWREGNREPRPEGAKDEFYNGLPEPYNAKLRRFDAVDELLLVRNFTPRDLFEIQANVVTTGQATGGQAGEFPPLVDLLVVDSFSDQIAPNGQTKLNINAANVTAQQITQRLGVTVPVATQLLAGRPYARLGDVLVRPGLSPTAQRAVLDNLTVNAAPRVEGKINVNTASEQVLTTLPGFAVDTAQDLLSRQLGGIPSLGSLLDVPGLNSAQALQPVVDLLTVSSQSFLVRAIGEVGDTRIAVETLVVIEDGAPRILRSSDIDWTDPIARWAWTEQTTGDTVLAEAE